jgi:hypothetical protein
MQSGIKIGSRVYLSIAVVGDPGCVVGFDRGRAVVEWYDLDLGRRTIHAPESLVIDEAFQGGQLGLAFGEEAA